jgi:hypothetical protein
MQFSSCLKAVLSLSKRREWTVVTPSQLNNVPRSHRRVRSEPATNLRAGSPVINLASLVLLRKEVIQPHVPVRLPCYDLVPVTDPTLGSSLQMVRPLTLGVADFRDLTGGVYNPRERIHRGFADPRLLATPAS